MTKKEMIELAEKVKARLRGCRNSIMYPELKETFNLTDQLLSALREPKCKTCRKAYKTTDCGYNLSGDRIYKDEPDCDCQPKAEPSEFTKEARKHLKGVTEAPWVYIQTADKHGIQSQKTMGSVFLFAHPKCSLKEKQKNERFIAYVRTAFPEACDLLDTAEGEKKRLEKIIIAAKESVRIAQEQTAEAKEREIQAVNDMAKLKRKLKNCVCPHCGFGFEQAEKGE